MAYLLRSFTCVLFLRFRSCSFGTVWKGCERTVFGFEAAVSAPCGRVANAPFLACLSSACSGVWPFRIRCQRASFLCLRRLGCLLATVLYLGFFYGFEAAVSAPCGRVANAPFLACLSSACVWPFRTRRRRAFFMSLSRLGCPTFFAHLPRSVSGLSCNGFDARPLVIWRPN